LLYFLMLMFLMVTGCSTPEITGRVSGAASSGVTITLSGGKSASATTDSSGNYSFAGLGKGSYTVTPSLAGYTFNPTSAIVLIVNDNDNQVANFTATTGDTSSVSKFAYTANSVTNNISVYTINQTTGALTYVTSVAAGSHPVSVTVNPSGNFVYAANEYSNTISVYTIDQSSGALTAGTTVAAGSEPVSVTVDPSGTFVYAANYGDGTIWVYTINQTTGALTHVSTGSTGMSGVYPQCVTTTTGAI